MTAHAPPHGTQGPRLHVPPPLPDGLVRRRRLDHLLSGGPEAGLVVVCAPAGYGTTTALAQWAAGLPGPVAWLDLTSAHEDPVVLLDEVVAALGEIGPLPDPALALDLTVASPSLSTQLIPRLGRCVRAMRGPFALVLDDATSLTASQSREILHVLAANLPMGCRLAIGCREQPGVGLASLRSRRRLTEVGPGDLAMTPDEGAQLLAGMGLRLDDAAVHAVVEHTEGWPAGLVLAGLVAADARDPAAALAGLTGDTRVIADFFAEEVLRRAPDAQVRLLLRTAVLDVLSAPACSAVLQEAVSAADLAALADANRFVTAADARGERFRHHRLFAEMLRAELRRRDPELARALHRRAADWATAEGDTVAAVRHRLAAGDDAAAADVVWRSLPRLQTTGRVETLRSMLGEFTPQQTAAHAPLALARAWSCVDAAGHEVGHWTRVAEAAGHTGPLPGGPAGVANAVRLLRATIGGEGLAAVIDDAGAAYAAEPDASPWRSLACLLWGAGALWAGQAETGRRLLREGAERAGSSFPTVHMICHSCEAAGWALEGRWAFADRNIARAREQVEANDLGEYASTALLWALESLRLAHGGDRRTSAELRARSRLLLVRNDAIMPWFGVASRILLARAAMQAGDPEAARTLATEAGEHGGRIPDAPVLADALAATRRAVADLPAGALAGPGALTTAELRVLQFLPTHLTFPEIGERVHLSRFTVKTQALSVYRKLGVGSRGEAVERARALGLLDA